MEDNQEKKTITETTIEENHTNTMEEIEQKLNKKKAIIIIAILSILLLIVVIVFLLNNDKKEPNNPNIPNVPTKSDDATPSDDEPVNNIEKVGNILYIYSAGYADMAPIAFTYECQSTECDLVTSTKGVLVYDNSVIKYRDFTEYEYNQIYGEDVNPVGEKLDNENFEEKNVTKTLNSDEYGYVRLDVYNIGDETFFLKVNLEEKKLYTKEKFCKENNDDICDEYNVITYGNLLYNFKNNEVIYELEEKEFFNSIGIKGEFIEVGYYSEGYNYSVIFTKSFETVLDGDNYYINADKIYYVENGKIVNKNSNNELLEYDNNDINAISIYEELLLYTDSSNNIKLKNLKDNVLFYESDIIVEPTSIAMFQKKDDGNYKIVYRDDSVWNNEEWINKAIADNSSVTEEDIRECAKNQCSQMISGYEITIDNQGDFVSKDYAAYYLGE